MIPSIENCRRCHNDQVKARHDCVTCHLYHDPRQGLHDGGAYFGIDKNNPIPRATIDQFLRKTP